MPGFNPCTFPHRTLPPLHPFPHRTLSPFLAHFTLAHPSPTSPCVGRRGEAHGRPWAASPTVSATRFGLFRLLVSGGVDSATSAHGLPAQLRSIIPRSHHRRKGYPLGPLVDFTTYADSHQTPLPPHACETPYSLPCHHHLPAFHLALLSPPLDPVFLLSPYACTRTTSSLTVPCVPPQPANPQTSFPPMPSPQTPCSYFPCSACTRATSSLTRAAAWWCRSHLPWLEPGSLTQTFFVCLLSPPPPNPTPLSSRPFVPALPSRHALVQPPDRSDPRCKVAVQIPDLVILLSPLGMHSCNLQSDPCCNVVVQIPGWSGLANANARATRFGDLYPLPPSQQVCSVIANLRFCDCCRPATCTAALPITSPASISQPSFPP
ncbi:unnamed protein product [Closterium sp. Naga37s-1]|nr:unnamed protein product [Closterium sp. Naga37s-1]